LKVEGRAFSDVSSDNANAPSTATVAAEQAARSSLVQSVRPSTFNLQPSTRPEAAE